MRRILLLSAVLFLVSAAAAEAQTVLCEAINGYRECRVGSGGTIRLVTELSDRACFEGATWGTRSDGLVWVDRGCRATFTIRTIPGSTRVVCESIHGKRMVCQADTTHGVTLVRQLSKADCFENETWGWDEERDQIWVNDGCRAEFILGQVQPARRETLDSTVVCESANGRRTECAANTAAGVQIVRQLGEKPCAFNRQWGYDDKGVWVSGGCRAEFAVRGNRALISAVVCESAGGTRVNCPADTLYGVAIVRQMSEEGCILSRTWGFDETGVWVDRGCRAQFALGGYRLPADKVPATAARVVCESVDNQHKDCVVETGRGVGLVRQISETNCILNRNWGYDAHRIWVDAGCRAEFVVAK